MRRGDTRPESRVLYERNSPLTHKDNAYPVSQRPLAAARVV
ncbi:hypothetical protein [Streptomyces sp. NPDC002553]